MDIQTAALAANMAKDRLEASGQIGRMENNSLSWDGNTDGKLVLLNVFARVSTKLFDLAQAEYVVITYSDGSTFSFSATNNLFKDERLSAILVDKGDPIVFVCTEEHYNEQYGTNIPVGVYFFRSEEGTYVSAIKCTETIHPIDSKYLPGVCLPVVEITSAKYPNDRLVNPSADESAKLEAAHQNGGVMIIKFEDAAGIAVTAVCGAMVQSGLTIYLAIPNYQFMRTAEGVWSMGSGTLEASASE